MIVALALLTAAALACYVRGLMVVRRHPQGRRWPWWRTAALAAAVVVTLVVTVSPVGEELETRLSTHMVQHMVLILVSAPLLALAAPGQPVLVGMPRPLRSAVVGVRRRLPLASVTGPHAAWALHIAALWAWHLPAAYDAALRSESVHLVEHACFLSTAWLFWWHLATIGRRRLRGPVALLYVVAAVPPGAALGAVLTFASRPLYPVQAAHAAASGINPVTDQRIGGLVMWVPLDFAYLALAVGLFAAWLTLMGRRWPEPDSVSGARDTVAEEVRV